MLQPKTSPLPVTEVSLSYLFFSFLKIGAVSFGGNMALIAVIKNIMVDKDQKLRNETILDAVGIASLLPGPIAVNVVASIGYTLRKTAGAIVSMIAILSPAVTVMFILCWLYFHLGWNQKFGNIFLYITGAVAAIILTTAFQFFQKEVKGNQIKILLTILGILTTAFVKGFAITTAVLVVGGLVGRRFHLAGNGTHNQAPAPIIRWRTANLITLMLLLAVALMFLAGIYQYVQSVWLQIGMVFSGISLSLFGGGYVMIPIMQSLFVTELRWLTQQEFLDAITFSQLTPGPILVSATFVGYKLGSWGGALLATFAIFTPSAILMILLSKFYAQISHIASVKNILAGVKAVVIGLIAGAAVKIGMGISWTWLLAGVTVVSLVLSFYYKTSPVYIVLGTALLAVGLWYVHII